MINVSQQEEIFQKDLLQHFVKQFNQNTMAAINNFQLNILVFEHVLTKQKSEKLIFLRMKTV